MANATTRHRSAAHVSGVLRALQVAAALTVLCMLVQGVTAGQLLSRDEGALSLHGGGAIVMHVLSAVATIATFLHWRATRGPLWPTVLSAVVFVGSFVQAYLGEAGVMSVHVPLAMVLTACAVAVVVWSMVPAARRG
jgi:hypothetical protein